ncbi:MAG TPA: hypothetical protein VEG32_01300 [Clostridia bacterium]|nr:hypothetical protein [Clostridia bacterium]
MQNPTVPRPLPARAGAANISCALEWLRRAQDKTGCGGVAAFYAAWGRWAPAYPETTGYIIPTLFRCAGEFGEDLHARAVAMAEWLVVTQLPCGSFPDLTWKPGAPQTPSVFNTGQILFGLLDAYRHTSRPHYLESAVRAGTWLVAVQDEDGKWSRFTYRNEVHSYNARVAWALLQLASVSRVPQFESAALKHLDWVLSCQAGNGWFRHTPFAGRRAFTHTIAYVLEGLTGAFEITGDPKYAMATRRTLDAILPLIHTNGYLPGSFDEQWRGVPYCCLTGNCQLAALFFRYAGGEPYLQAGLRLLDFVDTVQNCKSQNPDVRGAIAGSWPLWGRYMMLRYPNWAAKFFIDAHFAADAVLRPAPRTQAA